MKKLVLTSLLMFAFYLMQAQTAKSYSYAYKERTFVQLNNPTVVGQKLLGTDLHSKVIKNDSGVSFKTPDPTPLFIEGTSLPIGFEFLYNEKKMTHFSIMTNGTIYLGEGKAPAMHAIGSGVFTNYYLKNLIAAQFSGTIKAYEETQISYLTSGVAGSKSLVVEYKNILLQTASSPLHYDTTSFQIVLNEDKTIAFNFKQTKYSGTTKNLSFGIGIQQTSLDYTALTTSTGWENAEIKPTVSWTYVNYNATNYPKTDLSYIFSPPAPCIAPTTAPDINVNITGAYNFSGTIDLKKGADNVLILFQEGTAAFTSTPTTAKMYKKGDSIGNARVLASGTTSFSATALTASTNYTLLVFPYNEVCIGGPLYASNYTSKVIKTGFDSPTLAKLKRDKNSITLKTTKNKVGSNIITFMASDFTKGLKINDFQAQNLKVGDTVKVKNLNFIVIQKGEEGNFEVKNLEENTPYYFYSWSYEEQDATTTFSSVYSIEADQTWSQLPTTYNSSSWIPYNVDNLRLPAGWFNQIESSEAYFATTRLGQDNIMVLGSDHNLNYDEDPILLKSDVITPGIVLKTGKHKLKFDLCFSNNTGMLGAMTGKGLQIGDTLFVQISDDLSKDFTTIASIHNGNYSNSSLILQTQNISFSGFDNKTVHIRFLFTSPHAIGPKFNNVRVEQTLGCDYPSNVQLVEDKIGTNFAEIQWKNTNDDEPLSWNIKLYDVKLGEYTSIKNIKSENSALIEGLKDATEYQAQVQAICGVADSSFWSDLSPSFSTLNGIPFSENWDLFDMDVDINGWKISQKEFSGDNTLLPPSENGFNAWSMGFYADDYDDTPSPISYLPSEATGNWLISPIINMGEGNEIVKMNLKYFLQFSKKEQENAPHTRFMILVSTNNGLNWKLSDTIFTKTNFTAEGQSDTTLSINMKNYKGNIKIAFYIGSELDNAFSGYSSLITIDDFSLEYSCISPTNLSATPGEDTCLIAWDTKGTTSILRYKKVGDANFTAVSSTEKTMILTGLTPNTKYEYGVRNVCAQGDSSIWTNANFETLEAYVCDTVTKQRHTALTKTSANIVWVSDAEKFNIKWKEAAVEQWTEVSTTEKILALTNLKPGTSYEYKIQAICDITDETDLSAWTETKRFGTLNITCATPENYHNIGSTWQSLRFAWISDANQVIFAIKEKTEENFTYYILGKGDTLTISNLNQNTVHISKIAALCAIGDTSGWTPEITSTTVFPECDVPANLSTTVLSANSVLLKWEDAKKHHLYGWSVVYKTSSAARFDTVSPILMNNHTLTNLTLNTAYVWKVQGHCDNILSSDYSELSSFNTTKINASAKAEDFSVYADQGQIHILNPKSTMIDKVDILNINGQSIREFYINSPENVMIPLQLSKNLIIVKITSKGKIYSYKLVIK